MIQSHKTTKTTRTLKKEEEEEEETSIGIAHEQHLCDWLEISQRSPWFVAVVGHGPWSELTKKKEKTI